jgi:hypothetical protein
MFPFPPQPLLFVSLLGAMQSSNRKLPTHDSVRERFRTLKASQAADRLQLCIKAAELQKVHIYIAMHPNAGLMGAGQARAGSSCLQPSY